MNADELEQMRRAVVAAAFVAEFYRHAKDFGVDSAIDRAKELREEAEALGEIYVESFE